MATKNSTATRATRLGPGYSPEKAEITDDLKAALERLWELNGMIAVLSMCSIEELANEEVQSFADAMKIIIAPTFAAVDEGAELLRDYSVSTRIASM